MSYFWLVFTFAWLGSAKLQYISTGGVVENIVGNFDNRYPTVFAFNNEPNQPNIRNQFDLQDDVVMKLNHFSINDQMSDLLRKRRTINNDHSEQGRPKMWQQNLIETEKNPYTRGNKKAVSPNSFIAQTVTEKVEDNETETNAIDNKRNFGSWKGKKDNSFLEQSWSWKRSPHYKEPGMPKRVRFSPWGGKRSGQVIFRPGTKGSKVIFSSSVPEMTKIISNYSPNGEKYNLAGFQIMPDKRHSVRVLDLSAKIDRNSMKDALPFRDFIDVIPKFFKPGHPYVDVNIKKDGKRKVKFNAWGGKRSPPIIGPIWTQTPLIPKHPLPLNVILFNRSGDERIAEGATTNERD